MIALLILAAVELSEPKVVDIPVDRLNVPRFRYFCSIKKPKPYDGLVTLSFEHTATARELHVFRVRDNRTEDLVTKGALTGAVRKMTASQDEWLFSFKGEGNSKPLTGEFSLTFAKNLKGERLEQIPMRFSAGNLKFENYECLQGPKIMDSMAPKGAKQ